MLFVLIPLIAILGLVIFEHFSKLPFPKVENKTIKPMTREERLKICENCRFCERDMRGMVCGKTDEYADFEGECKEFEPSEKFLEWKKVERIKRARPTDEAYSPKGILYILLVAAGSWGLPLIYAIKDGATILHFVVAIYILISLSIVVVGIISVIRWMRCNNIEAVVFKSHNITKEKIMDIIRFEGYYPRMDEDGEITFKIEGKTYCVEYDGAKLRLSYRFAISPSEYKVTVAQIKELATSVSEGIIMANVDIIELPVDDRLGVAISLYAFCYYDEELRKSFHVYLEIVREAIARFGQGFELLSNETPRRSDIYEPEFRWMPDVLFKAVADGRLAPEALTDEDWIRKNIQKGVSSEDIAKEWNSFKINRVDNYGDYKLIVYQFPEPKVVPEAKYGAVLLNTQSLEIDYYTLEMTYNNKWVYGSMSTECHNNYGEVDSPDVEKFIEWIFTKDKQIVASRDYTKERQETVN